MKILYISSGHWWPHNNLDYGIINGFLQLGCRVVAVDVSNSDNSEFYEILRDFNPDFVFTLLGVWLKPNVIMKIKEMKYRIGVWIVDDPYDIDQSLQIAPYYDYIFNTEKNVISIYKKINDNVYYLPLGANESTFKIQKNVKYASDVCIIGTAYENRRNIVDKIADKLIDYDVHIIGILWDKLKSFRLLKNKISLGVISDEEAARFYSNAKINLNIHRAYDDETLRKLNKNKIKAISLNNRTFEIAATGAFQIIDYREEVSNFYKIDEEIVVFENIDDLAEKLEYYLKNEEKRLKIARNSYYRTLREHLLRHRLEKVLHIIENNR